MSIDDGFRIMLEGIRQADVGRDEVMRGVSYAVDADAQVILERTYDRSDRSEAVVAYDMPSRGDGFEPWNKTPRLGRRLGRCSVEEESMKLTEQRLNWREDRQEARYYGRTARAALRQLDDYQREADRWRRFADRTGETRYWTIKADQAEQEAVCRARQACHAASRSLGRFTVGSRSEP
jgi:hypothetical protein